MKLTFGTFLFFDESSIEVGNVSKDEPRQDERAVKEIRSDTGKRAGNALYYVCIGAASWSYTGGEKFEIQRVGKYGDFRQRNRPWLRGTETV